AWSSASSLPYALPVCDRCTCPHLRVPVTDLDRDGLPGGGAEDQHAVRADLRHQPRQAPHEVGVDPVGARNVLGVGAHGGEDGVLVASLRGGAHTEQATCEPDEWGGELGGSTAVDGCVRDPFLAQVLDGPADQDLQGM